MNEEEFPPIGATSPTYFKNSEFKTSDFHNPTQNNISTEQVAISPSNVGATQATNDNASPTDPFVLQYQDCAFSMRPRKKAISGYQARFFAVNGGITSPPLIDLEPETDSSIISRREKQIEYGKSTPAYERYITQVPKEARTAKMPRTPEKTRKYSRRQFDGMVKIWKIRIHEWDLQANGDKFRTSSLMFDNQRSPDNQSSGNISRDESYYEPYDCIPPNVEKTPTERAIEKCIMDWRNEYRVIEQVKEVPELSMVVKYKLGSPSNGSL